MLLFSGTSWIYPPLFDRNPFCLTGKEMEHVKLHSVIPDITREWQGLVMHLLSEWHKACKKKIKKSMYVELCGLLSFGFEASKLTQV